MTLDLGSLSRKDLEKLKRDVEKALDRAEKADLKKARDAATKAAAEFGVSLDELVAAPKPGPKPGRRRATATKPVKKGAAKYANPADPKQTWTGKGRQPAWYKDAIAAGKSPESMAI
ncbi:MAG: DNA-binding protein H-NS [Rhodobacteraceae bacterium HLUCCA08]|nr:MAG: DNA-binding protein H-NS [Rhodobacteraceae bacterium HLUCCA08]